MLPHPLLECAVSDSNFLRSLPRSTRLLGGAFLAAALSLPARAALPVGAPAPDFRLASAQAGQVSQFSLAEALKKGPVVLYFFPAAFTSGCNREAHAFAARIDDFKAAGATVIGVSNDQIDTITKFSVQECAGKFSVAADPESKVIKDYDAKFPLIGKADRISYVIGKDAKVSYVYSSLSPDGHIENTLKAVQSLSAKH
jgi:peroxiredoxin